MIRRASAALVGTLFGALLLTGCAHKDAGQCDFYQALGVNWTHIQGYVPSSVQDSIDEYC